MGIEIDRVQAHGILDILADELDLEIRHRTRSIDVDELALIRHRGHFHDGDALRVLRAVEVGGVRLVGELDLEVEHLSRLRVIEVHLDVLDSGVQILELHLMVERRHAEHIVDPFPKVDPILQVDGVEMGARVEVDVEHEHLESQRDSEDDGHALEDMPDGRFIRSVEALEVIDDVVYERRHDTDYREKPAPYGKARATFSEGSVVWPYSPRAAFTSAYTTAGSRSPSIVIRRSQPR